MNPLPLGVDQRHDYLDVLRGVAVLGILFPNILAFAFPEAVVWFPGTWPGFGDIDLWLMSAVDWLATRKSLTLLSVLLGAGLWLFAQRLEDKGVDPRPAYFRRCRWLLLFGLVHGFVFWHGDILVWYALCAMLAWRARRCSVTTQLVIAGVSVGLMGLLEWGLAYWLVNPLEPIQSEAGLPEFLMDPDRELAALRGPWLEQLGFRASAFGGALMGLPLGIWREYGLLVLGMALARLLPGFARRRPQRLRMWVSACLLTGLAVPVGLLWLRGSGPDDLSAMAAGMTLGYWVSLALAAGYAGCCYFWCRGDFLPGLRRRLAAVGQMALSLYLLQTLVCTTVFYGHGLGLVGRLSVAQVLGMASALWLFQLLLAPWWLARFRRGPMEWLWRSLTYGRHN